MNCELWNSSESKVNEKSFALRVYLFKYMYKLWLKSEDAQLAYTYSQTAGG